MYDIDVTHEQRELDATIRRVSGLESVRDRILSSNEVTVKDLMEIERLSPGSVYQNDTLRTAGLCGISDEVQVKAALEAINWSSAGGKGLIAGIIAVILVILRNVAGMLLRYLQKRSVGRKFEDIGHRLKYLYGSINETLCNFLIAPKYIDSVITSDGAFQSGFYNTALLPIVIVGRNDGSIKNCVDALKKLLGNLEYSVFDNAPDNPFSSLPSLGLLATYQINESTVGSIREIAQKADPNNISKYVSEYKKSETIQAMIGVLKKLKDNLFMDTSEVGKVSDLLIDFRDTVNLQEYEQRMVSFSIEKHMYVNYFVGLALEYENYSQSFKEDMTEHLNIDKQVQRDLIEIKKSVEEMDAKVMNYNKDVQSAYIDYKKHISDLLSLVNLLAEINAKLVIASVRFDTVFA